MAKYRLTDTGVHDTETGMFIPDNNSNVDWQRYQEWLTQGSPLNQPDPIIEPTPSIDELVDAITVEIDGILLTGNEVAQQRMARAIITMDDVETIMWQTNSGSPAIVNLTKDQLERALRAAGEAQVALWFA